MRKQSKEKSEIKNWQPFFLYFYKNIIGIECEMIEDLGKLTTRMSGNNLAACPFETISYTLIISKAALRYLKINDIQHSFVELIQTDHLNEEFSAILAEKFYNNIEPNYYEIQDIISRNFVKKEVVEEIIEILAKNKNRPIV